MIDSLALLKQMQEVWEFNDKRPLEFVGPYTVIEKVRETMPAHWEPRDDMNVLTDFGIIRFIVDHQAPPDTLYIRAVEEATDA